MQEAEIFSGMTDDEYNAAMKAINAGEFVYVKNQVILSAGDVTQKIGLVISGSVIIESIDLWGNVNILGLIGTGDFFAGSYALLGEPLLVNVRANEDSKILFLNVKAICESNKLMRNLLIITARKNLQLSQRSFINANKSIRRKVMSYFNSLALRDNTRELHIPFDRQQLADYLNVDRSALSKVLCSMRDEGIIDFHKNNFIIHEHEQEERV